MKLISWNVNGLRACIGKGFLDYFKSADADVFCLQETKLQAGQVDLDLPEYHQYWNYAEKKGYSGTAIFTKQEPLSVRYGLGVEELDGKKPVLICGDLNVAHNEIDLKNPGPNRGNAGFSDQEREKFSALLDTGFTDTFRFLHPDAAGMYSWWSYRFNARKNNAGWRIDYWLVSDCLRDRIEKAEIERDVYGSDHCPVTLIIRNNG